MDRIAELHAFETLAPYSVWAEVVPNEPSLVGDYTNSASAFANVKSDKYRVFDNSIQRFVSRR